MPNVKLYSTSDKYNGTYRDMVYGARALSKTNPELVKAEKEFIAGRLYPEIKVWIEKDGAEYDSPLKVPGDKTL